MTRGLVSIASLASLASVAIVAFAALLPGCAATYDHTDITLVGTGTLSQEASDRALSIVLGDVLTADVIPYNSDDNPMVGEVTSEDPTIVSVLHTSVGGYAFLGVALGTVRLTLYADGAVVGSLQATVRAQDGSATEP